MPTPGTLLQSLVRMPGSDAAEELAVAQTSVTSVGAGQGGMGSSTSRVCIVTADGGGNCAGYGSGYVMGQPSAAAQMEWPQTPLPSTGALAGKKVVQIAVGSHLTCVLDDAALPYCWGEPDDYFAGQPVGGSGIPLATSLGTNEPAYPGVPAAVDTSGALAGARLVALDTRAYERALTCALDTQGAIYCWGTSWTWETSRGTATWPLPTRLRGGDGFTHFAIGSEGVCAIDRDRALYCWDGSSGNDNPEPHRIDAVGTVKALSMGGTQTGGGVPGSACVMRTDDTVMCINMTTGKRRPSEWERVPNLDGVDLLTVSRWMYIDYDTGIWIRACGHLSGEIVCSSRGAGTEVPAPFDEMSPIALVIDGGTNALYPQTSGEGKP